MMRRRRGPGLLATAAVVGGASYVGTKHANANAQAAANEQMQNQQLADLQAQNAALQQQVAAQPAPAAPAAPAAAAPAAPADPMMAELQNLANLHTQGILSDDEFAAAKKKLLGI
jgi:Short C-terminal domain